LALTAASVLVMRVLHPVFTLCKEREPSLYGMSRLSPSLWSFTCPWSTYELHVPIHKE